ncbi:YpbF family protein [Bacillus shivajii]|uniref:DUF2663 family protein n=1 Tax=Bacillus shivajii TaxID=1983719 RepID=UPI001CFAED78|nr:DUF2663 family protein [Bacillus shivajii]UCZ54739.1 YpbF family protein [Bacillus shivajii]
MRGSSDSRSIVQYHEVVEQALIEAKQKEQKAEDRLTKAGYVFFSLLFAVILYGAYSIIYTKNVQAYLTHVLSDQILLFLILILSVSFYYMKTKKDKLDKAEKDYEELLEETIDRLSDIWPTSEKEEVLVRFHEMKDKHDVNLFHK